MSWGLASLEPWPRPALLLTTFPVGSGKVETKEVLLLWLCGLGQTQFLGNWPG